MKFCEAYLRPGESFLDVGANIGLFTLLVLAQVGKSGHVVAVEPVPGTVARLRENLARNALESLVTICPVAVGEIKGLLRFASTSDSGLSHACTNEAGAPGERVIDVPVERLDDLLGATSFAVMKVDCEGYELAVLKGGMALLKNGDVPVVICESNGLDQRYGYNRPDLVGWMDDVGYDAFSYDDRLKSLVDHENAEDLVFVRRSALDAVSTRLGMSERWHGNPR